jgi:hypothetical protein
MFGYGSRSPTPRSDLIEARDLAEDMLLQRRLGAVAVQARWECVLADCPQLPPRYRHEAKAM